MKEWIVNEKCCEEPPSLLICHVLLDTSILAARSFARAEFFRPMNWYMPRFEDGYLICKEVDLQHISQMCRISFEKQSVRESSECILTNEPDGY